MEPTLADVSYAPPEPDEGRGHLLDLYLPDGDGSGARPVVIWSSGSGFMRDDGKDGASAVAPVFAAFGYAVAGVSVRSSLQATFPAQVHDVKAAIRWLRSHAAEYGLDPGRFAIMGNSSGGWIAAMAALTSGMPELEGTVGVQGESSRVQVAVDLYGPTDFLQMDAHMPDGGTEFNALLGLEKCHADPRSPESLLVGGPIELLPDACARANPVTYVGEGAPPIMILHGQADPLVPHHQSELLYAALRDRGCDVVFASLAGVRHEHVCLADPSLAGGCTIFEARAGEERVEHQAPVPSWETVERFIANALG